MRLVALWLLLTAMYSIAEETGVDCPHRYQAVAVGTARDIQSGDVLYCEYHRAGAFPRSESNTAAIGKAEPDVYYSLPAGGELIATKQLRFAASPAAPEVVQRDLRHGEIRKVASVQGGYQLSYTQAGEEQPETSEVTTGERPLVIDAGFHPFVLRHWQTLLDGDEVVFDFVSVPHGRAIALRARLTECDQQTGDALCFSVAADSFWVRMFASDLRLEYDRKQRLRRFAGVVNISDAQGKSQKAVIDYRYPQNSGSAE